MQSRRAAAARRTRPAADSHHRPLISRRRARRLRDRLAGLIGSRYHMIRSIDAHLALKKLRESVPEVNAPECWWMIAWSAAADISKRQNQTALSVVEILIVASGRLVLEDAINFRFILGLFLKNCSERCVFSDFISQNYSSSVHWW